jgi:hypothetical protein
MMDEMMMREWNKGHEQFSTDLDHGLKRLAGGIGTMARRGMKFANRKQPGAEKVESLSAAGPCPSGE